MSNDNFKNIKNSGDMKFKPTKQLMQEYKEKQKLEKKQDRQAQQETRIKELEEKKQRLTEKRKQKLHEQKTKAEIKRLKSETSSLNKVKAALKEGKKELTALQKIAKTKQPQKQTTVKTTKGKDYIIVNGTLYQRKGTVGTVQSSKPKPKKEDSFL